MKEQVKFQNSRGEQLAGIMHMPDAGVIQACVVFAHCFTCTKNIRAAVTIADSLVTEGFGVLSFDFTGLGQSEGDFSDTHFSSNVQDLVDAAEFLAQTFEAPLLLVGHSLGGTAVLAAAHLIPSIVAVATIGAPADAEHVLHLLDDDLETIEQQGEAKVNLAGRPFHIRSEFVEDVRSQSVRDGIRSLRRALLVMHSPIDELVSIDEAARIYSSALHPKSFVSLDDADHLLTRDRDSRYAGQVLAAWASRYLPGEIHQPPAVEHIKDATVTAGRAEDIFLSTVNANGHGLIADEPESYGGGNRGPSPYDFLAAALGSCTVMTLNMYARRKELPVDKVEVLVQHTRIHAKDCEDCETKTGRIDQLSREIKLSGDLSDAQRQRMLEIADMCPVHRTLEGEIKIRSVLTQK
jgi:uncharacterized OsmC-like protein/pimeloyl-ACP methyl ester carboxylesterase